MVELLSAGGAVVVVVSIVDVVELDFGLGASVVELVLVSDTELVVVSGRVVVLVVVVSGMVVVVVVVAAGGEL